MIGDDSCSFRSRVACVHTKLLTVGGIIVVALTNLSTIADDLYNYPPNAEGIHNQQIGSLVEQRRAAVRDSLNL